MSFSLGLPDPAFWTLPKGTTPLPPSPFQSEWLTNVFEVSMKVRTPLTIAVVYFSFVHFVNPYVIKRQLRKAGLKEKNEQKMDPKQLKKLKPAPFKIATQPWFKLFVLLHNIFLCVYSVWTFFAMLNSFGRTMEKIRNEIPSVSSLSTFVHAVCDAERGVFEHLPKEHNLTLIGWWFYMSKFYEVIDTIVILLKGRPSSLLQSYHHAGAMMCMWSGIRFQSPPIWIFVVFNSFIHSLMYFYFTLACLRIRVPLIVKRVLTSMQITQFVVGGSLAIVHAFVWYVDPKDTSFRNCIPSSDQALPLVINVLYLTPLTALFAAFYIESYIKRKTA
ncbi:putative fatty acid elongation protein [Clavispora lusitaniae]|uniref:Elongation of fatty acids protein n=3 Tax=Clavispora lusitaniae TaxID=36911 RepID=C4YAL8_CLAL4|nr:uncharacterized protein CLUG_05246 [Clavispora lusitaniae ATCC 42720]OVF07193.1 putative elongation of fatty acids protein [Clavispora lusitaniae]EEQ41118.1 hypothetical protein CLUG_05246 [Clavispora lusitaniae ATCC 42720]QFZ30272.1 putative fatty acid elongation protein [Clavispora lusitaniae]QFZ35936.1 putative fatty acid elongation protein [Clavispora lusitaniae]QFZ41618.1 putative fatty acid elongation protein [Clavispora lusitaniae]